MKKKKKRFLFWKRSSLWNWNNKFSTCMFHFEIINWKFYSTMEKSKWRLIMLVVPVVARCLDLHLHGTSWPVVNSGGGPEGGHFLLEQLISAVPRMIWKFLLIYVKNANPTPYSLKYTVKFRMLRTIFPES